MENLIQIGSRVLLNPESSFDFDNAGLPADTPGTVIGDDGCDEYYDVKWDNGYEEQGFHYSDLLLLDEDRVQAVNNNYEIF